MGGEAWGRRARQAAEGRAQGPSGSYAPNCNMPLDGGYAGVMGGLVAEINLYRSALGGEDEGRAGLGGCCLLPQPFSALPLLILAASLRLPLPHSTRPLRCSSLAVQADATNRNSRPFCSAGRSVASQPRVMPSATPLPLPKIARPFPLPPRRAKGRRPPIVHSEPPRCSRQRAPRGSTVVGAGRARQGHGAKARQGHARKGGARLIRRFREILA